MFLLQRLSLAARQQAITSCVFVVIFLRKTKNMETAHTIDMEKAHTIDEHLWNKAIASVQKQFEVSSLLPEQEQVLRYFFECNDVFVNLPTGYGKSLIFQSIPVMADVCFSQPRGSNVIIVISPLKSLMEDQISYLHSVGVPAIILGDENDPEVIRQVRNGCYIVVYGSPESFLSTAVWRDTLADPDFQEKLVGVAIDKAHVVAQW